MACSTPWETCANSQAGILFLDLENPQCFRLHGTASVSARDPLPAQNHYAQLIVRVTVSEMFIYCPRYIHMMKKLDQAPYVPSPHSSRRSPTGSAWMWCRTCCCATIRSA